MKKFFTIVLLSTVISLQAQTPDSVTIGASYANKGYYTLNTMNDTIVPHNDWDIAVASYALFTVSIRINAGFGVELYKSAGDTTAWSSLDTTGLQGGVTWIRCHDSDTSFEPSAFETGATGHPNYGWGNYNSVTHDVIGDKIYVVRLAGPTAVFKKVWIKKFNAVNNSIEIRVANLDNTSDNMVIVFRNTNKNYSEVSLATGTIMDREPAKGSFDLVFEKYETDLGGGYYYPVTGVKSNQGVKVTKASQILPSAAYSNWYSNYYPSATNMIEIGYDWKTFDMGTFQWTIEDSLSYFVQDLQGDVYQITFTGFGGSTDGKSVFNVRQVGWVSVEEQGNTIANFNIYPNPASDFINMAYTMDNAFETATLHIIDINGKYISSQKLGNNQGFNQTMIDLTSMHLASGVYVAQLIVGNSAATQRFIVR